MTSNTSPLSSAATHPDGVTIDRITGHVGAMIGGVDLRRPLSPETVAALRQALLDYGVIFLRDQDLSKEQYWAAMENFGTPLKDEATGTPYDIAQDLVTGDMSKSRQGTCVWHADTTSLAQPPIVTALRSVLVPSVGGDTCWSSMVAAWEALSEPMQRMLDGLTAIHTVEPTIERMGEYGPGFGEKYSERHAREQVHPVVLTHPETGRKALYVNEAFVTRIVELDRLESAAVLAMLFRHVERPDFTMRWKWLPNDLAIWDNRAVQHYAVPDYDSARLMERIVLAGVCPGEPSALTPRDKATA